MTTTTDFTGDQPITDPNPVDPEHPDTTGQADDQPSGDTEEQQDEKCMPPSCGN